MPNTLQTSVVNKIRLLRLERRESQTETSKAIGYKGYSSYARLERGERDVDIPTLEKLANHFGVEPIYFFR